MAADDSGEARVARLVARVAALDDHDAFAGLVTRFQARRLRFLARLTHGSAAADDLAQDTFLKAYRHIASFAGRGRFASWLFRIAYQEFVTSARAGRPATVPLDEVPADGGARGRLEATLAVDQAMAHLRQEERLALDLHYGHQLTQAEVATVLDLPLGTVKSLIQRGRDKLRGFLTGPHATRGAR